MKIWAIAALAACLTATTTSAHAIFWLLAASRDRTQEPNNLARPRGPFLTEQELAKEGAKRPPAAPVYMLPLDHKMILAQAGQPGEPTKEVPYWRIELHPPNQGAVLTDPTQIVFASPGPMTGLFRTELPQAAAVQLNVFTYRMTGIFRVAEAGNHTMAVNVACTWDCNVTMKVAGQEIIKISEYYNKTDRIERFVLPLPVGEYPVEVVFGFAKPRQAESTWTAQNGPPRLNVLMRRPSDETLVPIEVFSRVPVSRATIPVPIK